MRNTSTFQDVIQALVDGATEGVSATGTLKIRGEQLIHYDTPIAERYKDKIIVNMTRYSLATGKLQKQMKELIPIEKQIIISHVEMRYKGSLADFVSKGDNNGSAKKGRR